MPQLLKRIGSAVILVLIMLATYYFFSRFGVKVLGIGIVILGICEYSGLAFNNSKIPRSFSVFYLVSLSAALVVSIYSGSLFLPFVLLLFPLYIAVTLWWLHGRLDSYELCSTALLAALGVVYLAGFSTVALGFLDTPETEAWFWLLLTTVIATDTFAYFSGLTFGKRKIMPSVSPKKTWAGSSGGLLGAALVAYLFRSHIEGAETAHLVATGIVASAFAQSGDLFESLLKRVAGVKDSGNIMPGHGGVLDRLDGILFAAPVFYISSFFVLN